MKWFQIAKFMRYGALSAVVCIALTSSATEPSKASSKVEDARHLFSDCIKHHTDTLLQVGNLSVTGFAALVALSCADSRQAYAIALHDAGFDAAAVLKADDLRAVAYIVSKFSKQ